MPALGHGRGPLDPRAFYTPRLTAPQVVALVVGDPAALTTGDLTIAGRVSGLGLGFVYVDDASAADLTRRLVVICESCSGATVGTKYRNATMGVVVFERAAILNMDMASVDATNGDVDNEDKVSILIAGHGLAGGLTGIVNVQTPGNRVDYNNASELAASAQQVYSTEASATQIAGYGYEAGATMQAAHVAEARRVWCGIAADSSITNLDFAGGATLIDAAIIWAMGSASGAVTLNVSLTEAVASSDAWARVGTFNRAGTETVASADAWNRAGTFLRALTSSVASSDAWAGVKVFVRALTESVASSDAWTRTGTFARSLTESVTSSDAWGRVANLPRALASSVASADAWTRSGTFLRALAGSVASADAWVGAKAGAILAGWSESVTSSDVWTRTGTFRRTLTGAVSQVDSWAGQLGTIIIGGLGPRIGSAVNAIVQAVGMRAGPPEANATNPTVPGRATTPKSQGIAETTTPGSLGAGNGSGGSTTAFRWNINKWNDGGDYS
jgi:hypothetical protein